MSNEANQQAPVKSDERPAEQVTISTAPNGTHQAQSYRQVAASHIDTLNEINRQLPKMLTYFATALTQLTNSPIRDRDQEGEPDTPEARQAAFRKYAIYVGLSVGLIRNELTKQINHLEQHKVIPKSHPKYTAVKRQGDKGEKEVNDPETTVKNGGYGEFDVGVLNARASSGQVGGEDVLDRLKAILDELKERSDNVTNGGEMAVDG
ncbi:Nn.00g049550.m01.CDS01 [Neocucurbitaria sp. VM-36]